MAAVFQLQELARAGDARGDHIIDGLKAVGLLAPGGQLTVDVLKVPHHGSKNNIDSDFVDTVVARDYVFCGNGEQHGNPHPKVVEMMARRRLAISPAPFKFWFNSSKAVSSASAHMGEIERIVKKAANASGGRMKFQFLNQGSAITIL